MLRFRVDSIMLLEEGFTVTSVDASDKMLKQAHKTRWNRRKEEKFDEWGNHCFIIITIWSTHNTIIFQNKDSIYSAFDYVA